MSLAVELVLVRVVSEMGGKVTFHDLQVRTNLSSKTLKRYLWYCQRKKLLRRDIGIYYITERGESALNENPIISLNRRVYAVRLPNKIHLITLGKKMRIRIIDVESLRRLLAQRCINRNEIKNGEGYEAMMSIFRLLKLLGMIRQRNEKICFDISNIKSLRELGIL